MSRIHPVKGILDLIGAWKVLAPEFTDWHLVIAGPDESGHLSEVEEALTGLERVLYVSVLQGEDRIAALGLSELFVLPSYSENFGLVVAEALAAGTPVVTTRAAPWSDIEYSDCGWWIDTGQHALNDGLRRALQCDPESLALMGQRGQVLIAEKYSWRSVATQVSELYETVLRPAPQAQDRGRVL
jgi:glycosyltransferase involved in cell wall biosynthesis